MWKITPLNSTNGQGIKLPSPQPLSPVSPTLINRAKEVLRDWQDSIDHDVRREEKIENVFEENRSGGKEQTCYVIKNIVNEMWFNVKVKH